MIKVIRLWDLKMWISLYINIKYKFKRENQMYWASEAYAKA